MEFWVCISVYRHRIDFIHHGTSLLKWQLSSQQLVVRVSEPSDVL